MVAHSITSIFMLLHMKQLKTYVKENHEEVQIFVQFVHRLHNSERKATGEKGPATKLELSTYVLSRSFSHMNH